MPISFVQIKNMLPYLAQHRQTKSPPEPPIPSHPIPNTKPPHFPPNKQTAKERLSLPPSHNHTILLPPPRLRLQRRPHHPTSTPPPRHPRPSSPNTNINPRPPRPHAPPLPQPKLLRSHHHSTTTAAAMMQRRRLAIRTQLPHSPLRDARSHAARQRMRVRGVVRRRMISGPAGGLLVARRGPVLSRTRCVARGHEGADILSVSLTLRLSSTPTAAVRRRLGIEKGLGEFVLATAGGRLAAVPVFFFFLQLQGEGEVVVFLLGGGGGGGGGEEGGLV